MHDLVHADSSVAMGVGARRITIACSVGNAVCTLAALLLDIVLVARLDHDFVLGRTVVEHVQVAEVELVFVHWATVAANLPLRLVGRHRVRERVRVTAQEEAKLPIVLASSLHLALGGTNDLGLVRWGTWNTLKPDRLGTAVEQIWDEVVGLV